MTIDEKRTLLEPGHPDLSIRRQCELLELNRSSAYYERREPSAEELALQEVIDRQYTATPFYGVPRMTAVLRRQGWTVNPKRVRRLMRRMGLEAIYPKPRLSLAHKGHKTYPYLLRNLTVERPDQVWATDITYIRLHGGFVYLTAVMDWYSRYVLSWELSNTLDASFCVEALEEALRTSSPQVFNSDQGSQYTSEEFTNRLSAAGVRISMDGRGRAYDNIFVERLWRTVKYEEVYLKDYTDAREAAVRLGRYFEFYNRRRPHQSLGWRTPAEVYFGESQEQMDQQEAMAPAGCGRPAAATAVGLRPPSVAAADQSGFHLISGKDWS